MDKLNMGHALVNRPIAKQSTTNTVRSTTNRSATNQPYMNQASMNQSSKDHPNHVRCAQCRYVMQDTTASEYTHKRCKGCALDAHCTCLKKVCKCGKGCEYRNIDIICPKQMLNWAAYECSNSRSEYHKALLNVTINGDKRTVISWSGCKEGQLVETQPSCAESCEESKSWNCCEDRALRPTCEDGQPQSNRKDGRQGNTISSVAGRRL